MIPIADVAPLYVGIEQGFFKEEKLEIEPKIAAGGAAVPRWWPATTTSASPTRHR